MNQKTLQDNFIAAYIEAYNEYHDIDGAYQEGALAIDHYEEDITKEAFDIMLAKELENNTPIIDEVSEYHGTQGSVEWTIPEELKNLLNTNHFSERDDWRFQEVAIKCIDEYFSLAPNGLEPSHEVIIEDNILYAY